MRVANSGCVLTPDRAEQVFDRFWRGDAARSGDGKHCGLGLSLCRELVDIQGGTIRARCESGGEFVIEFTLPSATTSRGEEPA
jgi:signal transduction histidine kinase